MPILARTADLLALAGSVSVPAAKRGVPWANMLARPGMREAREARMTAFVDTNILIRHLTGDPPGQATRATRFSRGSR